MEFNVINYYNNVRNSCVGLPVWDALHPQEQNMIINSINLLLVVCHNHGVTGKTTDKTEE